MKTTKRPPTTTFFDEEYFIYGDGAHVDPFDTDYLWEISKDSEFRSFMSQLYFTTLQIYDIFAFVCFFVNIPHLFILTRKELRSNLVYIIMIGVCICDLIHSLGRMSAVFMTWNIVYKIENCVEGYPYFHIVFNILAVATQIISRRCSGLLALFIAAFRAFSVIFPMSNAVNFLMKAKSGYLIILFFGVVCIGWGLYYCSTTRIIFLERCSSGSRTTYQLFREKPNVLEEMRFRMIDGFMSVGISLTYVFVAVALVIALIQAQKRRKNLKNDKPSNTTRLVIMMAVSLFISETSYGVVFILNLLYFKDYVEQSNVVILEMLALLFVIANSCVHCVICFFMSSQYRDVVKGLLCKRKEKEEAVKGLNEDLLSEND
ncbi:unnamed protein product [Caenorhabditis brenneri]